MTTSSPPVRAPLVHVAALAAVLLATAACSGGRPSATGSSAGSAPTTGGTTSGAPSAGGTAAATAGSSTAHATSGSTATTGGHSASSSRPASSSSGKPAPSTDPIEAQIQELEQSGGVASVVVRVKNGTVTPTAKVLSVPVGQTLRLILLTDHSTRVVGDGVGVDTTVKANTPTAVDMVAFSAGSYDVHLDSPMLKLLRFVAH